MIFAKIYLVFLICCLVAILYRLISENKLPYGKAIATKNEEEIYPQDMSRKVILKVKKKKAIRFLKKYHRKNKIEYIPNEAMKLIINEIIIKYPQLNKYRAELAKVFVQSEATSYKGAKNEYNGSAYDNGATGITFGYIQSYLDSRDKETEKKDKIIGVITYILLHELSHHEFRFKLGFFIIKKHSEELLRHVNEVYADLNAFRLMQVSRQEAVFIMTEKSRRFSKYDIFKTYTTHPSDHTRTEFVERGIFNEETIDRIAEEINVSRNRTYIKSVDILFAKSKLREFKESHPDTILDFTLE